MRQTLRRIVETAAARLPWSLRAAVCRGLARSGDYRWVCESAQAHGIVGFLAQGEYGLIEGSSSDEAVFRRYLEEGVFAADTIDVLIRTLSGGGTYLDVGANIGLTTIPVARNPLVRCQAFEPDPTNFQHLRVNVARNCHYDNVDLHNVALFDREETLTLELNPTNAGDKRIRRGSAKGAMQEQNWETKVVRSVRLDDQVSSFEPPLVVKIDTQGAEPFVLSGGRECLSLAEVLAIEFWPYGMARSGGDVRLVVDFIESDFVVGRLAVGPDRIFGPWMPTSELAAVLRRFAGERGPDDSNFADVLVAKRELP
jgi:FkbM family methyltransferase